jgi:hypothetical protein
VLQHSIIWYKDTSASDEFPATFFRVKDYVCLWNDTAGLHTQSLWMFERFWTVKKITQRLDMLEHGVETLFRELTEYFLFLNREFLEQPREWSSYQPR